MILHRPCERCLQDALCEEIYHSDDAFSTRLPDFRLYIFDLSFSHMLRILRCWLGLVGLFFDQHYISLFTKMPVTKTIHACGVSASPLSGVFIVKRTVAAGEAVLAVGKGIDARGWLQRIKWHLAPGQYLCASPGRAGS